MSQAAANVTEAPRRSVLVDMSTRFGMEPAAFEATLRATVVPKDCSKEQFAAFLLVAKEYSLNPVLKEIYAFPARSGGIQPIVSIDGWLNIINSHPQLDGIEFDDHIEGGKVTAITARIWRKDREKPIIVTEYLAECIRSTDTWKQYPRRMLRHKALIQCARYAFGFAGIVDPDEAERMDVDLAPMRDITPRDDGPPKPPTRQLAPPTQPDEPAHDQVVWEEAEERAATTADMPDIPAALDRRPKPEAIEATAADVFDPAQWLKDLEGALGGCEDFAGLGAVQGKMMAPQKGKIFPPDWDKATKLFNQHVARINQTVLDAG